MSKYTDKERQEALDWLKAKIKPRLPFARGRYRMTEEQLDSVTIDLEDPNNKSRIVYLLNMVWRNWVSGEDYLIEWDYRLLPVLDQGIISMDSECNCVDPQESDLTYFEIYCKLMNNSEAITNATSFIECMEHEDVQVKLSSLENTLLWYKWKYEPERLTEEEKRLVGLFRFKDRSEEETRLWLTNDNYVAEFPGDSVVVEADAETEPLPM